MYDKYRIAKKWVEDVQNHANWAKETFERVILIPCVILIEACSVVRLRRTATFNVGVGGGAARSGRTAPPLQDSSVALLPQNDNYPDSLRGLVANGLKILYFAKLPKRQIPTALIGGYLH